MPTMHDVARQARVSIATVSHVINNTRPVSDELRTRVLDAMAALNYQPNAFARALRSKQSLTIGVIVPDSSNPFFADLMRGIEDVSLENEYSVMLGESRGDLNKEIVHTENLVAKQVDGIIFAAAGAGAAHIEKLVDQGVPVVLVERDPKTLPVDAVLISNFEGGQLAARHLLALGHTQIACITGPKRLTLREDRLRGFVTALAEAGITLDADHIREGNFSTHSGYQHAQALLRLAPRPTAIFAFNDMMALGVLRAAHELGIAVPDDLSIVGFDDTYLAAYAIPPLTTITLPTHEMGRCAMQLLLDRINNPELAPRKITLDITLTVRHSTAPAPAS
ncbi:MAG: substrate-binding domain-containing protein [Anaerolineae bacterium]